MHDHAGASLRPSRRGKRLVIATIAFTLMGGLPAVAQGTMPGGSLVAADPDADLAALEQQVRDAEQRWQESTIAAAKATERFNQARERATRARAQARRAEERSERADKRLSRLERSYVDAVVTSYQMGPEMSGLAPLVEAGGVSDLVGTTMSSRDAQSALQRQYRAYERRQERAQRAERRADAAADRVERATSRADGARDEAAAAVETDLADLERATAARDDAVAEYAPTHSVSTIVAEQRIREFLRLREVPYIDGGPAPGPSVPAPTPSEPPEPSESPAPTSTPSPTSSATPTPSDTATPSDTSSPSPTPPPATGAAAAIKFARAQLGKPYEWGADGPNSYDCSGLTMRAWEAGGKSLSHSSRMQYSESTPISRSQLRPGDLVFWGSSPSSIYHVALYVGDGKIVHAPRTGRPVSEESIDYWIAPNYFARP